MKKIVFIIIIAVVLFVGALFVLPLFFKDELRTAAQKTLNNNINAEVEFKDFRISLINGFPQATLELTDLVVKGIGEFKNDTLFQANQLRSKVGLFDIFKKSGMSINEILLENPSIHLIVSESGLSNWDLVKESSTTNTSVSETKNIAEKESSFQLKLESVIIKNGSFVYNDKGLKMLLSSNDINVDLSGDMFGTSAKLDINGELNNFLTEYEGVKYISNATLKTITLLQIDYDKMDISILENELLINRLPLQLTGEIKMPSDSMFFDMQLKSKESGFENFLALVPAEYEMYLKDIESSGIADISGSVKGLYFEDDYPAFSLKVDVKNGQVKYADLPEEISKINANILVNKVQGILNLVQINIKDAHAEVKNSPVDLSLKLNNLMEDPYFDGALIGKINFSDLKEALPFDSVNISGIVDANLFLKGKYSAIENEKYQQINSSGVVLLTNFIYQSLDLTQPIIVPDAQLDFSPESIKLPKMQLKIGASNFNLTGTVSNYLNYIFKESTLLGNFQLSAPFANLNELLLLQKNVEAPEITEVNKSKTAKLDSLSSDSEQTLAFSIPENIDFTFKSKINQAVYGRLQISTIEGLITAKNGELLLNGLSMNMLDGKLNVTGSYKNTPTNEPFFNFGINAENFDIPKAYQSLAGFRRLLPGADNSTGKLSTGFNLNGRLNQELKVFPITLNGNGNFKTSSLYIANSPIFKQLEGILKKEKLQNITVNDFMAHFTVEDGNILLKPFETKIAGQETKITGTLNAQNLIDLRLDFNIEREAFGSDIQNILSAIPGNKNIDLVPAGVLIKGPVGNPEVKMDLSETRKTITNAAKDDLQNSLNKVGKGLLKLFEK